MCAVLVCYECVCPVLVCYEGVCVCEGVGQPLPCSSTPADDGLGLQGTGGEGGIDGGGHEGHGVRGRGA